MGRSRGMARCDRADLRGAQPGFVCRSSAKAEFELLERAGERAEFWLERRSGLAIAPVLPGYYDETEGAAACAARAFVAESSMLHGLAWRLPTADPSREDDDLVRLHRAGFTQVVPNIDQGYLWSASPVAGSRYRETWAYVGGMGDFATSIAGMFVRALPAPSGLVLCVADAPGVARP
jgi:hypothetical protein